MKNMVDKETGVLVLIPERPADRLLLFHLMNCNDMCQFSEYIKYENAENMTLELGIPYDKFRGYLGDDETSRIQIPVTVTDTDSVVNSTEKDINQMSLIGFNR